MDLRIMISNGLSAILIGLLAACDIAPNAPVLDGNKPADKPSTTAIEPTAQPIASAATVSAPNILLIVADDLGYFDIGAYGGEIKTPNLDDLATRGVRFRQLRTAPVCAPARAMLMTGLDHHAAGVGDQFPSGAQVGQPGYEGHLLPEAVTIAERLQSRGYHTIMAGKWHLGEAPEQSPAARGFDSSFVMLLGAGGHFDMTGPGPGEAEIGRYRDDGELVDQLPDNFYSTRFYTDRILADIKANRGSGKPFFAYAAYTSPHWPLQVPEEYLNKYQGKYDQGYEALCRSRMDRAAQKGVLASRPEFTQCRSAPVAWSSLNDGQKTDQSRRMEIYASMVENLDAHIGRLISDLEESGELDNTFVVFMSDNGADEGHPERRPDMQNWIDRTMDNSLENMGRADSFISYGPGWASAGMSPFRDAKGTLSEGGIRVPFIVAHPSVSSAGGWNDMPLTMRDIAPTLLEIASVNSPAPGQAAMASMTGRSFLSQLKGEANSVHPPDAVFAWEFSGSRTVVQSGWKLLNNRRRNGTYTGWMLFDLSNDPFEIHDVSAQQTDRMQHLLDLYQQFSKKQGVVELSGGPAK